MATVGRGAEQYTVRFPDGLRDRIKAAAEANNRSMNAEIIATLEEKYPHTGGPLNDQWYRMWDEASRLGDQMRRISETVRGYGSNTEMISLELMDEYSSLIEQHEQVMKRIEEFDELFGQQMMVERDNSAVWKNT